MTSMSLENRIQPGSSLEVETSQALLRSPHPLNRTKIGFGDIRIMRAIAHGVEHEHGVPIEHALPAIISLRAAQWTENFLRNTNLSGVSDLETRAQLGGEIKRGYAEILAIAANVAIPSEKEVTESSDSPISDTTEQYQSPDQSDPVGEVIHAAPRVGVNIDKIAGPLWYELIGQRDHRELPRKTTRFIDTNEGHLGSEGYLYVGKNAGSLTVGGNGRAHIGRHEGRLTMSGESCVFVDNFNRTGKLTLTNDTYAGAFRGFTSKSRLLISKKDQHNPAVVTGNSVFILDDSMPDMTDTTAQSIFEHNDRRFVLLPASRNHRQPSVAIFEIRTIQKGFGGKTETKPFFVDLVADDPEDFARILPQSTRIKPERDPGFYRGLQDHWAVQKANRAVAAMAERERNSLKRELERTVWEMFEGDAVFGTVPDLNRLLVLKNNCQLRGVDLSSGSLTLAERIVSSIDFDINGQRVGIEDDQFSKLFTHKPEVTEAYARLIHAIIQAI